MPVALSDVVRYLNDMLRVHELPDEDRAVNGLQFENEGVVSRFVAAVDACQFTIDAAGAEQGSLLLVHHGLFWGGVQAVVGTAARRVKSLVANDTAVYSAHIPLDVHPEFGNNVLLAHALGLDEIVPFGDYRGIQLGVRGESSITVRELAVRIENATGRKPLIIPTGPDQAGTVSVVTGAGASMIREAAQAGISTFVTGEGAHHTFFDAEELGINLVYAGHYATETFGVRALASHLSDRFALPFEFIDHPTGL